MNLGSANNPATRAAALAQQAKGALPARNDHYDPQSAMRDPRPDERLVSRPRSQRRVHCRELVSITSQLAIMTRAGVDVAGSLQSLVRQRRQDALREVLHDVHQRVLSGNSLSEAMAPYSSVFGPSYIASVAAGESSGSLPDVLRQLADLLRSQLKLRNSLRAMLAYPAVLTLVSGSVLLALLLFVLPKFQDVFADFDAPLPVITQILLAISGELRFRFWLWIPLLGGLCGIVALFLRSDAGRGIWDRFTLHCYILRDVTRSLLIGRTCHLLGIMIESGVPLLESLRLSRSAIGNRLYQRLFEKMEQDVLNGRGLALSLAESEFIPPAAAEMVITAEKTGTLGTVTHMLGKHYQEEGEARLREMVAIVEPLITVVMGCGVAIIVMSVMLPLFDLSSAVKGH